MIALTLGLPKSFELCLGMWFCMRIQVVVQNMNAIIHQTSASQNSCDCEETLLGMRTLYKRLDFEVISYVVPSVSMTRTEQIANLSISESQGYNSNSTSEPVDRPLMLSVDDHTL